MRGKHHAPATPYPGKDLVPIVQEAGWASGPVWTGAENLALHRDSIPRLSLTCIKTVKNFSLVDIYNTSENLMFKIEGTEPISLGDL